MVRIHAHAMTKARKRRKALAEVPLDGVRGGETWIGEGWRQGYQFGVNLLPDGAPAPVRWYVGATMGAEGAAINLTTGGNLATIAHQVDRGYQSVKKLR